jgi:hypothetical protein
MGKPRRIVLFLACTCRITQVVVKPIGLKHFTMESFATILWYIKVWRNFFLRRYMDFTKIVPGFDGKRWILKV